MSERTYTLASTGAKIESFLQSIIRDGGFDLKFTLSEGDNPHPDFENPNIMVRFRGPDVELLLANKAELMLAFEQLTMEVLRMALDEHSQMCFDANDYRVLRVEELRLSAQMAAERVKKSRQPYHFNPMNSRERRILHLALRAEKDVRSESVGMGPMRAVVVYPAGMSAAPAPLPPRRRR